MSSAQALKAPEPVLALGQEAAADLVALSGDQVARIERNVDTFLDRLIESEIDSDPFQEQLQSIHRLGSSAIREAASVTGKMLDLPARAMREGLLDDGSQVGQSLTGLRSKLEELDPSRHGDLLSPRKLFGFIPLGSRLSDYFEQYRAAQNDIAGMIQTLYKNQDTLTKENAAIKLRMQRMREAMQQLEQQAETAKQLDAALVSRLDAIEQADPEKARIVREELLFEVRRKIQDLLTQLTVTAQGYMAIDMIRRNNLELIKGVDRATTTTVSALRTAVLVAQAVNGQKLLLERISALNSAASKAMTGMAGRIREDASSITGEEGAELETLKSAFADIYSTMDMLADYKGKALDSMRRTVDSLSTEVDKAEARLEQAGTTDTDNPGGDAFTI
jgi:uncharacterized protein YaaN involved in tellurite resistance